jgi:hypothetical protein
MPDGLRVLIRRSKTDPEAQGQEIAIPRGTNLRPVETLQAWLARRGRRPLAARRFLKRDRRVREPTFSGRPDISFQA